MHTQSLLPLLALASTIHSAAILVLTNEEHSAIEDTSHETSTKHSDFTSRLEDYCTAIPCTSPISCLAYGCNACSSDKKCRLNAETPLPTLSSPFNTDYQKHSADNLPMKERLQYIFQQGLQSIFQQNKKFASQHMEECSEQKCGNYYDCATIYCGFCGSDGKCGHYDLLESVKALDDHWEKCKEQKCKSFIDCQVSFCGYCGNDGYCGRN